MIELIGSFYGSPLYMEISYPLTIFAVFITSIYSLSGSFDYLVTATAFLGSYYLLNSIRTIIRNYAKTDNIIWEIAYGLVTVGICAFSIWFQMNFTPVDAIQDLKKTEKLSGSLTFLRKKLNIKLLPKAKGSDSSLKPNVQIMVKEDNIKEEKDNCCLKKNVLGS